MANDQQRRLDDLSDEIIMRCFALGNRFIILMRLNKDLRERAKAVLQDKSFPLKIHLSSMDAMNCICDSSPLGTKVNPALAPHVTRVTWRLNNLTYAPHELLASIVKSKKMTDWSFDFSCAQTSFLAIGFLGAVSAYTGGLQRLKIPLNSIISADQLNHSLRVCAPTLVSLYMYCVGFECPGGFRGCEEVFSTMTKLQRLNIQSSCKSDLTADHAESFAQVLKGLGSLRELHVKQCFTHQKAHSSMVDAISRLTALTTLNFSQSRVSTVFTMRMAHSLKCLRNLQNLNLSFNEITSDGAKALANCFPQLLHLRDLRLSTNPLCDEGCKAIGNALHHLADLQYLDLNNVEMCGNGAIAMGNGLSKLRRIHTLDLSENKNIPSNCFHTIHMALAHMHALRRVNLMACNLVPDVTRHVAEALRSAENLECLMLSRNNFGDEGGKHITNAVELMRSLQKLYVRSCGLSGEGKDRIRAACKKHPLQVSLNV